MPAPAPQRIRILLVDDHSLVRMGLASVLSLEPEFEVIAEADDGESALAHYRAHHPHIVLMDVRMPGIGGVEAVRQLRALDPEARILMLTTYDTEEDVFQALQAGASGYLLKSIARAELTDAIRRAHRGESCVPPTLAHRLADRTHRRDLTPRERQVLDLMRLGYTNRDIGLALGFTAHTAKAHVKAVMTKLDSADRAEAVANGFERGLLKI
jgi:DNA-binding NarL/FixJ family response regulator